MIISLFPLTFILGALALGLLIWSTVKLVGQFRARLIPDLKFILLTAISLTMIELILFMGILIFTGLGHSECFKRQGDIACRLSLVVVVVCPTAFLLLFRAYLKATFPTPEAASDILRQTAVIKVKVTAVLTGVLVAAVILYLLGRIGFWPPLMFAVKGGHLEMAAAFLSFGADSQARDICGHAPLPYAMLIKDTKMVRLLVEKGVDINSEDEDGLTALSRAIMHRQAEMVSFLLANSARVNVPRERPIPLVLAVAGEEAIVRLLLDNGADVNATSAHGTALTAAAAGNRPDLVKVFLESGANHNLKTASGQTPLMAAALGGHLEVVKILLENGANPFLKDDQRYTAANLARQRGHGAVAETIEDYSTKVRPEYKVEALVKSIMDDDMTMVLDLLSKGVDLNTPGRDFGKAALVLAVDRGRWEMAKLFIDKGADVNTRDRYGRTPLMSAAGWGNLELVRILLSKGADPNAQDRNGRTALAAATSQGHHDVREILLKSGAK